jgi:hypothetical protein
VLWVFPQKKLRENGQMASGSSPVFPPSVSFDLD